MCTISKLALFNRFGLVSVKAPKITVLTKLPAFPLLQTHVQTNWTTSLRGYRLTKRYFLSYT